MKDIIIGANHPAWVSLDDDDWNGATLSNFLTTIAGHSVVLRTTGKDPVLVKRMREVFERNGAEVKLEE